MYMITSDHFLLSLAPITIYLHLLMTSILLVGHLVHWILKAIFLVVLAFFLKMGLV